MLTCAISPTVNSGCSYEVEPNQSLFSEHGLLISRGTMEIRFKPVVAMTANITNTPITLEALQDIETLDLIETSHQIHSIEIDAHDSGTTIVSTPGDTRLLTKEELIKHLNKTIPKLGFDLTRFIVRNQPSYHNINQQQRSVRYHHRSVRRG